MLHLQSRSPLHALCPPPVRQCPARPKRCRRCETGCMQKYTVVVHEEPEGGFWAEVPALPGCYSQADSMSELMDNVREAISGVLAVKRGQRGRPELNVQIVDICGLSRLQGPDRAGLWELLGGGFR